MRHYYSQLDQTTVIPCKIFLIGYLCWQRQRLFWAITNEGLLGALRTLLAATHNGLYCNTHRLSSSTPTCSDEGCAIGCKPEGHGADGCMWTFRARSLCRFSFYHRLQRTDIPIRLQSIPTAPQKMLKLHKQPQTTLILYTCFFQFHGSTHADKVLLVVKILQTEGSIWFENIGKRRFYEGRELIEHV